MEDDEEAMLSEAFNVTEKSRLGCQIAINKEIDVKPTIILFGFTN